MSDDLSLEVRLDPEQFPGMPVKKPVGIPELVHSFLLIVQVIHCLVSIESIKVQCFFGQVRDLKKGPDPRDQFIRFKGDLVDLL